MEGVDIQWAFLTDICNYMAWIGQNSLKLECDKTVGVTTPVLYNSTRPTVIHPIASTAKTRDS